MGKLNSEDLEKFYSVADEKETGMMNDLLSAVLDWHNRRQDVVRKLETDNPPEAVKEKTYAAMKAMETPAIACMKSIEYFSSNHGVSVFCGNSNNIADVIAFADEVAAARGSMGKDC